MKVSEYFFQNALPWLGVGTIVTINCSKYVIARVDGVSVGVVNVHGHSHWFGPRVIKRLEVAIGDAQLTEEEARELFGCCYSDATIVGRIS